MYSVKKSASVTLSSITIVVSPDPDSTEIDVFDSLSPDPGSKSPDPEDEPRLEPASGILGACPSVRPTLTPYLKVPDAICSVGGSLTGRMVTLVYTGLLLLKPSSAVTSMSLTSY